MHPILGDQLRLRLHLTAWSLAGAVLALLVRVVINVPWVPALSFGIPLGLVAAPVSLSAWYLCRAMPLVKTSAVRVGITAVGAAYLAIVCLIPEILIAYAAVPFYLGGTSLLIVVSVTMDTVAQVQGHLLAHQYEGLIKKSKLRGRRR